MGKFFVKKLAGDEVQRVIQGRNFTKKGISESGAHPLGPFYKKCVAQTFGGCTTSEIRYMPVSEDQRNFPSQ